MEHSDQIIFKNINLLKKERLDIIILRLIQQNSYNFSRSRLQKIIKESGVYIDGNIIHDPNYSLSSAKELKLSKPTSKPLELKPKNSINFKIVHEDEDLIVIDKPAGMTVHPGAGNHDDTLANELVAYANTLSKVGGFDRPGIVHRLDKDTSGLMVVAKNDEAHFGLSKQLETRELSRNYYALVYGIPNQLKGVIQTNIGRDNINRKKMRVTNIGGKEAITHYEVIKLFEKVQLSLIECKLKTGRTHQIRVHMNNLGHPLVGDQVYNNNRKYYNHKMPNELKILLQQFSRQALHSYKIAFVHPRNHQVMQYQIELSDDIQEIIQQIDNFNSEMI